MAPGQRPANPLQDDDAALRCPEHERSDESRRSGEHGGGDRRGAGVRRFASHVGARASRVASRLLGDATRPGAHLPAHRGTPGTGGRARRAPGSVAGHDDRPRRRGPDDGQVLTAERDRPGARRVDRDQRGLRAPGRVSDPPVPDGRDPDGPGRAERDELRGRPRRDRGIRRAAAIRSSTGSSRRGTSAFRSPGGTHIVPRTARSRRSRGTGEASTGLPTTGARRGSMRTGRWVGRRSKQGCPGATRSTSSDASLRPGGWDLGRSCSRRGAGGLAPTRSRRCNPAIASASPGRSGGRGCSTRSAACHASSTTAGPSPRDAGRRSAGAILARASGSRATAGCCWSSSTAGRDGRSA